MLFDLQGKRRRVVQATYLTLAVLMGGGLVLFGIGSESGGGGLFDAFSGNGSTNNDLVEERIERNEKRVQSNPKAIVARKELVRDYYNLAGLEASDNDTSFPPEARDELTKAAQHWDAYVEAEPKQIDPSFARVALQLFDVTALDRPKAAADVAQMIAKREKTPVSYVGLVYYSTLAGDERTADLAAKQALVLAPKGQRKSIKQQVDQARAAQALQQAQQQQSTGAQ
jgi:hypothetical protein